MSKLNTPVLTVKGLEKSFGRKRIIEDVTFSINEGEVFGFLGPNGAGKTTVIRMLVGLIKPSGGEITIAGFNLEREYIDAMKYVGCIVENPEMYGYLTGWQNLKQFAAMIDLKDDSRIIEIVKLVNLLPRIHEKVKNYSLGMKQRLGIAQALLCNPKLLILDEPTNGLDPAGIRELRSFIQFLVSEHNISVFISSHHLSEIQMMCNRVAIINKGQIIKDATVDQLIHETRNWTEFSVSDVSKGVMLLSGVFPNAKLLECEGGFKVQLDKEDVAGAVEFLTKESIKIYQVKEIEPSLEELFLKLTGGDLNEAII